MTWSDLVVHLTGLAHLATVTPDGRPHISVVAPAIEHDTIWIATNRTSRKAHNLAATPAAALVWQPGAEVYVHADTELVDDVDIKRRLWDGGVFPYDPSVFFESVEHPDFVLIRLVPTTATVMEMSDTGPQYRRWRASDD